jgi:hypothetical protein
MTAPHVVVAISCLNARDSVRRAVDSILHQSYGNLTVVVVFAEGASPAVPQLARVADSRLITVVLKGAPALQPITGLVEAAVLDAIPSPYLLTQGADDWSEADRIAVLMELLREDHAVAAVSAEREHLRVDGIPVADVVRSYSTLDRPLTPQLQSRGRYCGLFSTEALRLTGGPYAGFPIGFEVLVIHFLLMIGQLAYVDEPLYNRTIECCRIPSRNIGCARTRKAIASEIDQIYDCAFTEYLDYLSGNLDVAQLTAAIGRITKRLPLDWSEPVAALSGSIRRARTIADRRAS